MYVTERTKREKISVAVQRVENFESRGIKKLKGFSFDWQDQSDGEIYKLRIEGSGEIIGLVKIVPRNDPHFKCVEIVAIEKRVWPQNEPDYQGVAGNLIAFAARQSFKFGLDGFLFLIAKTKSAEIFNRKYGLDYLSSKSAVGVRMSSDTQNSIRLIREFIVE